MKFDYILGNPPYQDDTSGDQNSYAPPIYDKFMDAAYEVSDRVMLIHPARFLFNAGGTSKAWNEKMLHDEHFKIVYYEPKSANVFPGTIISGGVVISYRDKNKTYGPIDVFTPFEELNSIINKVDNISTRDMSDIVYNRGSYRYSDLAYAEQPQEMRKTSDRRVAPNAFERMPALFTEEKPSDGNDYIQMIGIIKAKRVYRWFRRDYLAPVETLDKYKIFIAKADGAAGQIGSPIPARICGKPFISEPGMGATETFLPIGAVDDIETAQAIEKYIKSKFARTMLGVLKVTPGYARPVWRKVPLQDFTPASDIDWSASIPEIDRQLYRKYGLDDSEIDFIETHVKEMN